MTFTRNSLYFNLIWLLLISISFVMISIEAVNSRPDLLSENELFQLFAQVNHFISFFIPLVIFIFFLLSSNLIFFLFDFEFDSHKIGQIICISLLPILINSVLHIIVLSDLNDSQISSLDSNYAYHITSLGLSLIDMNYISYLSWFSFYVLFGLLIYENTEHSVFSIICIVTGPSVLIAAVKLVLTYFS